MHIWLYEMGHNQHDENKKYTNEDICEIVAYSNDFINEVVEQYNNIETIELQYIDRNEKILVNS